MRKNTLFLSAVLTAFVLAVLVGVISAYQNVVAASVAQQPTAVAAAENISVPQVQAVSPTATAVVLTPEQAAALAAQVLGRTDLFSVETADFNGASAYLVTFSSGDLVYVSPAGQILSVGKIVPTVVVNDVPAHRKKSNDEQINVPVPDNREHDDDHDEHDD
jgi:hypothetical protein